MNIQIVFPLQPEEIRHKKLLY